MKSFFASTPSPITWKYKSLIFLVSIALSLQLSTMLSSALVLLLLPFLSVAQQYQGAVIPNSLPTTPGSKVNYFKIDDGHGGSTTLINYFSSPGGKKQDPSKVKRAVVVLHGLNRDPATYISTIWAALGDANKLNSEVTERTVAIMAPYFPSGDDKNTGYVNRFFRTSSAPNASQLPLG